MSDDLRGTIAALTLVVGLLTLVLFGGSAAPAHVAGTALITWFAFGVRTGWWVGLRTDVDTAAFDFLKKLRFFKVVKDQMSAEQEQTPEPRRTPQPLD